MSDSYLMLADGTTYDHSECGYAEGVLWCYLPPDTDMSKAFSDFIDTAKTEKITWHVGTTDFEYEGFNEFMGISKTPYDKRVQICIRKAA